MMETDSTWLIWEFSQENIQKCQSIIKENQSTIQENTNNIAQLPLAKIVNFWHPESYGSCIDKMWY